MPRSSALLVLAVAVLRDPKPIVDFILEHTGRATPAG
jgi:hypothetical protein